MKTIVIILMAGMILFASNVFAQDDVLIDSSGNVTTGVSNSNSNLEVTGASGEHGVVGETSGTGAAGVYGVNTTNNNYGILGYDSYGVYGESSTGYAGYFQGNVTVTGDLSIGGTLTGYTETDPQVGTLNSGRWCTSDGSIVNCTSVAPVTSETDPFFSGSAASGITAGQVSNWDTSYGWGDHASAGYDATVDSWTGTGDVYTTSGNVGIGTTNPTHGLELHGAGYPTSFAALNSTGGNFDAGLRLHNDGPVKWHIFNRGSDDLFTIRSESNWSTPAFAANFTTGKVGIGTTTPNEALTVSGTIESTSGGIKFPDGSVQTTASTGGGGGVPSGYMILGDTPVPPSGYTSAGLTVTANEGGDQWSVKTPVPTPRDGFVVASVNDKIYVIGGFTSATGNVNEEYDPATETWTNCGGGCAPMPTSRGMTIKAVTANGKIYVIGGLEPDAGESTINYWHLIEEYDPSTNTWTNCGGSCASIPTYREAYVVASANNKIYIIGGTDTHTVVFDIVEEFDPDTNTWTNCGSSCDPVPTPRYDASAVTVNNKIYLLGGYEWLDPIATNVEFDPSENSWVTRASMPDVGAGLFSTVVNNKIYALRINNWEYDPYLDLWATKTSKPSGNVYGTAVANNRIYAMGGLNYEYIPYRILHTFVKN